MEFALLLNILILIVSVWMVVLHIKDIVDLYNEFGFISKEELFMLIAWIIFSGIQLYLLVSRFL